MNLLNVCSTDGAVYPLTPRTLPHDDAWLTYIAEIALPAAALRGEVGMVALYRRILAEAGREVA